MVVTDRAGSHDEKDEKKGKESKMEMICGTVKPRLYQRQCLYFDLILTYKIFFHLNDLDADAFFTFNRSYSTRGHMYKLFPVYTRVDVYKYFFSNRVVEPWNCLPAEPHHFSSLSTFKTFLRSVDLSQFVQQ